MPFYRALKTITFCYGHRLYQYDGPCRHLHGHNGKVEVVIATQELDANGMACDFRHMKAVVKEWIDTNLDHRMILQAHDPLVATLQAHGEPMYLMAEPPTAENIARTIFQHARERGLPVVEIRLWESEDACAIFREEAHG